MAESPQARRTPTPTNSQPLSLPQAAGHEVKFVKPSDYLRPRAPSRPVAPSKAERPIDRDERLALVRIENLFFFLASVAQFAAREIPPVDALAHRNTHTMVGQKR